MLVFLLSTFMDKKYTKSSLAQVTLACRDSTILAYTSKTENYKELKAPLAQPSSLC